MCTINVFHMTHSNRSTKIVRYAHTHTQTHNERVCVCIRIHLQTIDIVRFFRQFEYTQHTIGPIVYNYMQCDYPTAMETEHMYTSTYATGNFDVYLIRVCFFMYKEAPSNPKASLLLYTPIHTVCRKRLDHIL